MTLREVELFGQPEDGPLVDREFHLARERHALAMAALSTKVACRALHRQLAGMHAEKASLATTVTAPS